MGPCVSRLPGEESEPNVFRVFNVDEAGRVASGGRLELTEACLVLHQRRGHGNGKCTVWPLKFLRR